MGYFCTSLYEHPKAIIDFEKKKMLTLTKEELKSYPGTKVYYIFRKRILKTFIHINCQKIRGQCHYAEKYSVAAHSNCN